MNSEQFNGLSLLSVPSLVRFDPATKERTLVLAQAVAEVFTELQLGRSDLAAKFRGDPEAFNILLGDLNEKGFKFARGGFQRWLANTDRWTTTADLDKFKSTLLKQWAKAKDKAL